ncbi:MAG: glycerophosphodiester phosphodiesterase family protein [Pseudomonadota bacterium]
MRGLSWLTERPVAHRGLHDRGAGRIENSRSAIQAAIDRNFAIEVDLQMAGDCVPMVFHDASLDRLTFETGRVRDWPSGALKQLVLSGSTDTIPTFADLLTMVAGSVPIVVELKPHGSRNADLAASVATDLQGYSGPVALMSFDPDLVSEIARSAPNVPRGIVADATPEPVPWSGVSTMERFGLRHLLHIPRTRPHFIAYDCQALPAAGPFLWSLLLGLPVLTWTVRGHAEMNRVGRWTNQIIFEGFDPDAPPARNS